MTDTNGGDNVRGGLARRQFLKSGGAALAVAGIAGCSDQSGGGGESNEDGSGSEDGDSDGGSTGTTTGAGTIRFWNGNAAEGETRRGVWEDLVSRFNDQHSDITVEMQVVPNDQKPKKLRSAAAAGSDNLPHIIDVASRFEVFDAAETMEMTELWESSNAADMVGDTVIDLNRQLGRIATGEDALVTWPQGLQANISIWRADWLEAAGYAREDVWAGDGENEGHTSLDIYDDLEPILREMKESDLGQKEGHYPSASHMKMSDEEYLAQPMGIFGASRFSVLNRDATNTIIETQPARDAISWQTGWVDEGLFHPSTITWGDEETTAAQWSGNIAYQDGQDATDGWNGYLAEQPDKMKNLDYVWGVPPSYKEKRVLSEARSFVAYQAPFNNQRQKEAAATFMDWVIANPENIMLLTKQLGFIPIAKETIDQNDWFGQSDLHKQYWRGAVKTMLDEYEMCALPPITGSAAINLEIPNKMHQRILQQGVSVKKATSMAADAIRNVLKENDRFEKGATEPF